MSHLIQKANILKVRPPPPTPKKKFFFNFALEITVESGNWVFKKILVLKTFLRRDDSRCLHSPVAKSWIHLRLRERGERRKVTFCPVPDMEWWEQGADRGRMNLGGLEGKEGGEWWARRRGEQKNWGKEEKKPCSFFFSPLSLTDLKLNPLKVKSLWEWVC